MRHIRGTWNRVTSWLGRFVRAEDGNVAMVFALTLVPISVSAGAGLDMARELVVRSRLTEALDAAGLAVGGGVNLTDAQINTLAQQYFDANYKRDPSLGTPAPVAVVRSGQDVTVSSHLEMPTTLTQVVGIDTIPVSVSITVTHSSVNLEVALALDTTGSMAGSKVTDLKAAAKDLIDLVVQDVQTPTYSKIALVPYSMGVNVGGYASQVRGAIAAPTAIADAAWAVGAGKAISGATRANPVVVTANAHGFSNGDKVYIKSVVGMTQLNNKVFTVAGKTANTFQLSGVNGTGYNNYTSNGTVTKCKTATCEVVVTANGHGFANGDVTYITGVSGMTQINNLPFTVANATANTFVLSGTAGTGSNYISGGSAYCTTPGCEYQYFTNAAAPSAQKIFQVSTCVTERTGADAYTDTAPSTAPLGRNYPAAPGNPCIAATIRPLISNKTTLKADIDNLSAAGSTGGHIGMAWAWYMLSPNFGYLWDAASAPAAYTTNNVVKVAVLMTDGEFNSPYCKGVIAKDATAGSGATSDHINCTAPNGNSFAQAQAQCGAMKTAGVIVYTVGFDVVADPQAQALMANCATDMDHAYLANSGTELKAAFHAIAQDITQLRVSR